MRPPDASTQYCAYMVIDGLGASLIIIGDAHTAAEVTSTLGIQPSEAHEAGWKGSRGPIRDYSWWCLNTSAEGEEEHRLASVGRLAKLLHGKADALASLADRYEMRITWAGTTDATQGGFVITAELLTELGPIGAAGVDVLPTVYLERPGNFLSRLRFAFSRY